MAWLETPPALLATALREANPAILAVALTKVSIIIKHTFVNDTFQSKPELLEVALTDATEDNLKVALTPARNY